jgi:hypothetical protein
MIVLWAFVLVDVLRNLVVGVKILVVEVRILLGVTDACFVIVGIVGTVEVVGFVGILGELSEVPRAIGVTSVVGVGEVRMEMALGRVTEMRKPRAGGACVVWWASSVQRETFEEGALGGHLDPYPCGVGQPGAAASQF